MAYFWSKIRKISNASLDLYAEALAATKQAPSWATLRLNRLEVRFKLCARHPATIFISIISICRIDGLLTIQTMPRRYRATSAATLREEPTFWAELLNWLAHSYTFIFLREKLPTRDIVVPDSVIKREVLDTSLPILLSLIFSTQSKMVHEISSIHVIYASQ